MKKIKTKNQLLNLLDVFLIKGKTTENIAKDISKKIDTLIINTEKQDGLLFISGTLKISAEKQESILAHTELYFQDKDKSWIHKSVNTTLRESLFEKNSLSELFFEKEIEYEVIRP